MRPAERSLSDTMLSIQENPRYKYNFNLREKSGEEDLDDDSKKAIQSFVNSALGLMTGGCEVCVNCKRMYCEKQHHPVNRGDARCEYFARRPSATIQR